jgi:hypothetical protein
MGGGGDKKVTQSFRHLLRQKKEQRRQYVALASKVDPAGKPEVFGPESNLPSLYRNKAKC